VVVVMMMMMKKRKIKKKFWEELIAYFPLMWHGQQRNQRVQQFFYCVCIHCRMNAFTEPWPRNGMRDTRKDTQTARGSHKPTFIFSKIGKVG
jgi:hypothetical protein